MAGVRLPSTALASSEIDAFISISKIVTTESEFGRDPFHRVTNFSCYSLKFALVAALPPGEILLNTRWIIA